MVQNDTEALLNDIAVLKTAAQEYIGKLQDAEVRKRIIEENLTAIGQELYEALGTLDWSKLDSGIEKAAKAAQDAVQRLSGALDEAGVDYS